MMTNEQREVTLLTPREKAAELRVSEQSLARWRRQGSGPRWVKLGKSKTSPVRYFKELP